MKIHEVIRKPLVTEKSTIAREEENVITFSVDPRATKYDIKGAVETLFNVDVITVRTMRMPRKKRRLGRFWLWVGYIGHLEDNNNQFVFIFM